MASKSREDKTIEWLAGITAVLMVIYNLLMVFVPLSMPLAAYPLAVAGAVTLYYIGLIWRSTTTSNDTRRTSRILVAGAWFLTALVVAGTIVKPNTHGMIMSSAMAVLDICFPLGMMVGKRRNS